MIGSRFAPKLPNGKRPEPDVVVAPIGTVEDNDSIFEGRPLIVAEITSTSTRDHDLNAKLQWFKEALIPEIWIIDRQTKHMNYYQFMPASETYQLTVIREGQFQSSQLPGFTLMVEEYF